MSRHLRCINYVVICQGFALVSGLSIWDRVSRHKQPVVEPQESAAFPATVDDFRAKLVDPSTNGVVFFAVCRHDSPDLQSLQSRIVA